MMIGSLSPRKTALNQTLAFSLKTQLPISVALGAIQ
jgi:hypothetical protein